MIKDQNPLDKALESLQDWFLRHLGPILTAAFLASLAFLVVWLSTTLFWPIEDAHRVRQEVILADDTILSIDYPQRILIQDEPTPLFLTITSDQPVSTTIELPSSLPLLLSATEPTNTLYLNSAANGQVVIEWLPPVAATDISSQTVSAVSTIARSVVSPTIPILQHAQTISLQMSNGQAKVGAILDIFTGFSFTGFSSEQITFLDAKKNGTVRIDVETTARASWRAFAKEYPFIASLPLIIPILGAALKIYGNRVSLRRQERAKALLTSYTEALRSGEGNRLLDLFNEMSPFLQYYSESENSRLIKVHRFCEMTIGTQSEANSKGQPSEVLDRRDFAEWPEIWVDALFLVYRRYEPSSPIQKQLRSYIRVFPKDQLSVATRRRFQELQDWMDLVPVQRHSWPMPADSPPEKYSRSTSPDTWTIEQMDLFPFADASLAEEQKMLYADATRWFWPGHPLYEEIIQTDSDYLVYGDPGSGKTALALALSLYAPESERVLASYHATPARVNDVRLNLARSLIQFARSRPSWLSRLEHEERELLSRVLLSILDARYLIAQLERPDNRKFEDREAEWQSPVWLDQSAVEKELLRQSIEKLSAEKPLPLDQWFLCLGYCAGKLGFEKVRSVFETTNVLWNTQGAKLLSDFAMLSGKNGAHLPIQLIVVVSGDSANIESERFGLRSQEMQWIAGCAGVREDPLLLMLQHRAERRGMIADLWPVHFPAMTRLAVAADGSPQRLALLWRMVQEKYSEKTVLTKRMVDYAKRRFNDYVP